MAAFTAITTDCTDRTAAFGYIDSVQIQNSGVRTYVRNGVWAESHQQQSGQFIYTVKVD